jgi:hypothetical protein
MLLRHHFRFLSFCDVAGRDYRLGRPVRSNRERHLEAFPVPQARLRISSSEGGRAVGRGTSWGGPIARCRIAIRRDATREELDRDWVLTHELFHFAFPSVPEANHWMEEGVSTYVEPIARAKAGLIQQEQVWADLVHGLPQGLPAAGDQGLDVTHTWGRT